jgi:hypothetical protein
VCAAAAGGGASGGAAREEVGGGGVGGEGIRGCEGKWDLSDVLQRRDTGMFRAAMFEELKGPFGNDELQRFNRVPSRTGT